MIVFAYVWLAAVAVLLLAACGVVIAEEPRVTLGIAMALVVIFVTVWSASAVLKDHYVSREAKVGEQ